MPAGTPTLFNAKRPASAQRQYLVFGISRVAPPAVGGWLTGGTATTQVEPGSEPIGYSVTLRGHTHPGPCRRF